MSQCSTPEHEPAVARQHDHAYLLQADKDNPELPENARGSWYSNPAAASAQQPAVRTGVGKYIASAALDAKGIGAAAAAAQAAGGGAVDGTVAPVAKKPKLQQLSNFDAW